MSLIKRLYIIRKRTRYLGKETGIKKIIFVRDYLGKLGCTKCRYYDLCEEVRVQNNNEYVNLLYVCASVIKGYYYVIE